jgi:hypothetical protein
VAERVERELRGSGGLSAGALVERPPPPQTGISICSTQQYIATTGAGIGLLHYLVPVVLHFILLPLWLIGFVVCLIPAIIASSAGGGPNLVSMVLGAAGIVFWLWLMVRCSRKLLRGFDRHTKYNYVDGYGGPLAPMTGYRASRRAH